MSKPFAEMSESYTSMCHHFVELISVVGLNFALKFCTPLQRIKLFLFFLYLLNSVAFFNRDHDVR